MLSFAPLFTLLLTLGSPVLSPPDDLPKEALRPAATGPATCRIEVRLRDVSEGDTAKQGGAAKQGDTAQEGGAAKEPGRLIARGTFEIDGGKVQYRTGERTPIVTYVFEKDGWKANTTFQNLGVELKLHEPERAGNAPRTVTYECRVGCILDVVGNVTPIIGEACWSGAGHLKPGKPIVLTALTRIDGRLRQYPKNHPLNAGKEVAPLPDRVVEIEARIELLPAPRAAPGE